MDLPNNYMALELLKPLTRESIHSNYSMIVLKNEDNIWAFLVQAFRKGRGGKPFTQIREVYKKALSNMQEISRVHACVYSVTLGQFLVAPVKCVDVDNGRVRVQVNMKKERIILYCTKITLGQDMSKKRGMFTDTIKVLPLDFSTRVIKNVYTSKR